MRALVSGSTGFSGGFLVAALRARGFEVHAVSQRTDAPGVERIDLTSSAAWASAIRFYRPDHVFHLSGVAHSEHLADFAAQNTAAAAALLDATWATVSVPGALLFVGNLLAIAGGVIDLRPWLPPLPGSTAITIHDFAIALLSLAGVSAIALHALRDARVLDAEDPPPSPGP